MLIIIKYLFICLLETLSTLITFMLGALWQKVRIAKKEQPKDELIGKWVQPTGEKMYAGQYDTAGQTIPKFVKNDFFMATNIENDRVLLCKPIGWVHRDEITWYTAKEDET